MGSINNSFRFGTVDSADYNLLVAGDGTFNAPERDVDTIEIPGRNGDLLIDKGRFKNITVEYTVYCYADDLDTFRTQLRNFRNALSSQKGYQKLTDTFHPDEYRLGTFISGFEAEPVMFNTIAEVVLKFDCKPQRFLLSGDEPITLGEWGETETYSGSIVSFDGTETTAIKSLKVNIVPKQSGSGDPSPSNVRPISGYEGVNVEQRGKNLLSDYGSQLPYSELGVSITGSGGEYTMVVNNASGYPFTRICTLKGLKKGTYRISSNAPVGGARIMNRSVSPAVSIGDQTNRFIITEDITDDLAVELAFTGSQLTNGTYYIKVQLELGSTATDYEPYEGESKSISLGQTVYGGVLDVVSGKLSVDSAIVDLGSLTWAKETSRNCFSATFPSNCKIYYGAQTVNAICSKYKAVSRDGIVSSNNAFSIHFSSGANYINIHDDTAYGSQTATQFKTAMNGVQLVYPLATPTEIQLTPTQVKTLLGSNNIWADAGTIEVEVGENPYILVNPTPFTAQPIFEVEGSGTLTVNNSSMTIANNGTTVIDSEMMEAYEEENGAIASRNDMVSGEFPTLKEGNNNIGTVGLTSVKVKPKWWEV